MPSYLHRDEEFMRLAIEQARLAAQLGEIPVGAVVVKDDQVIGRGYNRREIDSSATAHAEVLAIEDACKHLGTWRLTDCELYVTLEPCPMCAGAIINARIRRVIYGAKDERAGCCGSVADFFVMPFNHNPLSRSGILAEECKTLLLDFFSSLRNEE
ncbi:MAG: tRNA adenosine(34) deaminase TadA [Oscillospiraceae bacterium]|nr:tRNA adenosine(34) deaminase TadA [Oscillospiraceae bacterium]